MLLALAENGITADVVVGTSVGAINAAYVANHPGLSGVEGLAAIWSGLTRANIFPTGATRLLRVAAGREAGLANPAPLRRLLEKHLELDLLEDAALPVTVVATEVMTGREVQISRGPAVDAVMASAAL